MDFDAFVNQAWDDHADDSAGVAQRLQAQGLALLSQESQIGPLAHLAHHVFGEHLGRWRDGQAFLQQLAALPACTADGAAAQGLQRYRASLDLCAGAGDARPGLSDSDRIRVTAMAAAALAERDAPRALALFEQALADADATALPDTDPYTRALAVSGNNLASTLEEKAGRSADERRLMILAAQTARRYWALAGGWMETERAEYRLAKTWLQAGDVAQARQHAQNCLEIVDAQDPSAPALERFFGWEALGAVERAAGNGTGLAQALAEARTAFAALEEADRGWCQASLDALKGSPATV